MHILLQIILFYKIEKDGKTFLLVNDIVPFKMRDWEQKNGILISSFLAKYEIYFTLGLYINIYRVWFETYDIQCMMIAHDSNPSLIRRQ